jgi:polyisoprenoid-binding protein YceI
MKRHLIFFVLTLLIIEVKAQDKTPIKVFCDKTQSSITYSMNHLLHSWEGECKEVNSLILTDEKRTIISQVAVSVKIASFDSKNANRDSHAMEATEALLYPSISFTSTSIKQTGEKLMVTGVLKFHGISQIISFEAQKKSINNRAQITGNFIVKMTQFKIKPPSLLGIAADDEIKIAFYLLY